MMVHAYGDIGGGGVGGGLGGGGNGGGGDGGGGLGGGGDGAVAHAHWKLSAQLMAVVCGL
jgi:hypothetical protein